MKNFILFSLLTFFLTGCIPNGTKENGREFVEISIDPDNVEKVRLSDIFTAMS